MRRAVGACVLGDLDVDLGGVDLDVDAGHLPQLAQLGVGERGLRRTATAEQDTSCTCAAQRVERVVGDVGATQLVGVEQRIRATSIATLPLPITTARSADRSKSRRPLRGGRCTRPRSGSRGRSRGGPRRGCRAGCPSACRSRRRPRGSARAARERDVLAQRDPAEERKPGLRGGLLVHARDGLDVRVIGCDAGADETEGRRQRVEQIYGEARRQQLVGGVEAGRAGADDGDPHALHASERGGGGAQVFVGCGTIRR